MVNYYSQAFVLYENGKEICREHCNFLAEDTAPKVQGTGVEEITWENLSEVFYNKGLWFPFTVWNLKKGRLIEWFSSSLDKPHKATKEWKTPSLNLSWQFLPAQVENIPLSRLMSMPNGDMAIKYLVQRGMSIIKEV